MIVIVAIVVIVAVVWANSNQPAQPPAVPLQPPSPQTQLAVKPNAGATASTGLTQVVNTLTSLVANNALHFQSSKDVLMIGMSLAVTIGMYNVVAGIIVAVVVWLVAYIVEFALMVDELVHDNHVKGLTDFDDQWKKVHDSLYNSLYNKILAVQSGTVSAKNVSDIELCASAYADGYMQQINYLRATAGAGNIGTSMHSVYGAWRAGAYAGSERPKLNNSGVRAMCQFSGTLYIPPTFPGLDSPLTGIMNNMWGNGLVAPGDIQLLQASDTKYGDKIINLSPPSPKVLGVIKGNSLVDGWGRMGEVHGNASMVFVADAQPHGVGQSQAKHLNYWRDNGMWQGVLKGAGEVPVPGIWGVQYGTSLFYTVDGKTPIFVQY